MLELVREQNPRPWVLCTWHFGPGRVLCRSVLPRQPHSDLTAANKFIPHIRGWTLISIKAKASHNSQTVLFAPILK